LLLLQAAIHLAMAASGMVHHLARYRPRVARTFNVVFDFGALAHQQRLASSVRDGMQVLATVDGIVGGLMATCPPTCAPNQCMHALVIEFTVFFSLVELLPPKLLYIVVSIMFHAFLLSCLVHCWLWSLMDATHCSSGALLLSLQCHSIANLCINP
jgi:hypothetical protein